MKKILSILIIILLFSLNWSFSKSQKERLEKGEIIVERIKKGDEEGVRVTAIIDAPLDVVWEVATDYENFEEFMPNIEEYKILHREKNIVYTSGTFKLLFIKIGYNLKYTHKIEKDKRIDCWEQATGKYEYKGKNPIEFKKNYGCWTFEKYDRDKTKTKYEPYIEFEILEKSPTLEELRKKIEDIIIRISAPGVIEATRKRVEEEKKKRKVPKCNSKKS